MLFLKRYRNLGTRKTFLVLFLFGLATAVISFFRLDGLIRATDATKGYFLPFPVPVAAHISTGIVFLLACPALFITSWRVRRPGFHRWLGRTMVVFGTVFGLTGIWMVNFFPVPGGRIRYWAVTAIGTAQVLSLLTSFVAIRQRDVPKHRRWVFRATAIGYGSATQLYLVLPLALTLGDIGAFADTHGLWISTLINVSLSETLLYRAN